MYFGEPRSISWSNPNLPGPNIDLLRRPSSATVPIFGHIRPSEQARLNAQARAARNNYNGYTDLSFEPPADPQCPPHGFGGIQPFSNGFGGGGRVPMQTPRLPPLNPNLEANYQSANMNTPRQVSPLDIGPPVGMAQYGQNNYGQSSFGQNAFDLNTHSQNMYGQNNLGQNGFDPNTHGQDPFSGAPNFNSFNNGVDGFGVGNGPFPNTTMVNPAGLGFGNNSNLTQTTRSDRGPDPFQMVTDASGHAALVRNAPILNQNEEEFTMPSPYLVQRGAGGRQRYVPPSPRTPSFREYPPPPVTAVNPSPLFGPINPIAAVLSSTQPATDNSDAWSWSEYITWPEDDLNRGLRGSESSAPDTVPSTTADDPGSNDFSVNFINDLESRIEYDETDPLWQALLKKPISTNNPLWKAQEDKPIIAGAWEPKETYQALNPLIAYQDIPMPTAADVSNIHDGVDQAMEGYEKDKGHLEQLVLTTNARERAELVRQKFRRCWQITAIQVVYRNVFRWTRNFAPDDTRPLYFIVGRDALCTSKDEGKEWEVVSRFGWYTPENRWAWLTKDGENLFCDAYPSNFRLVDMQGLANAYSIDEMFEQRFPIEDEEHTGEDELPK
ncbi:hypothetical protein PG999_000515 [Apiospora kogelbergensis]|uniref:Uncharacterized protein n=1 Tax=Apiospora kogelbergensis TaxID=1337665 RepID=A0AAW0RBP8_9PEZI